MASNSQPQSNLPSISGSKAPVSYSQITNYAPWIVIGVVLIGAGQFDSTAQLAAGFAYLILVGTILYYGEQAMTNVNKLVNSAPKL